jgi:acyl-CoA synthetase (AMP-forming)/AMP-acid ligase II
MAHSVPSSALPSIAGNLEPLAGAETLTQVLHRRAQASPDAVHIHLWHDDGRVEPITYGDLFNGAAAVARSLQARGLRRGETVAMMLPTGRDFFPVFFGTLLAGGIPVPIYPPFRANQIEEYAGRQSAILQNAQARLLITFRQAERLARLLKPRVPSLGGVVTADRLERSSAAIPPDEPVEEVSSLPIRPDEVALIQYTSGSTGEPRGVALTHRNLLANLVAIGHGVQVRADDVVVCWLPLYHDMGLIGCWLYALYFGLPITVLSPLAFLRRPERWLQAIHRQRGTLSPAPNFAYELCVRRIPDRALEGLDLSSWRVALNGAEPVNPATLDRFIRRFATHGFRAEALMPVYGLAECSVALTFAPLGRPPRIDRVARDAFQLHRRADPAQPQHADALEFVSVGSALPDHEVRIVNEEGRPVPERVEGHVEFQGPSSMKGYYRNPEANAAAQRPDGWFHTGDLAYQAEGELFITGRTKDLIIKAGRNVYPQEIEEAAADVDGVRRGCVVAFAVPDHASGTERLVLVAETRETDHAAHARIVSQLKKLVGSRCRISPDSVALVPPQTVPKTPSGKLRRGACRDLYLQNRLVARPAPVWLQVTRLLAGNARALFKRGSGGR